MLGKLFNRKGPQAAAAPQEASADPSEILNRHLAANPDDVGKAYTQAGLELQKSGNPEHRSIAANLITRGAEEVMNRRKDLADVEGKELDTDTKRNQLGNPGNVFQGRSPNGDLVSMAPQFDKKGVFTGYQVVTKGPSKETVQNIDDPRTGTQQGEDYQKVVQLMVNTETAIESMRQLRKNMEKGAAQGWVAAGVGLVDNVVGSLDQLVKGAVLDKSAETALSAQTPTFEKWAEKTGVNASIWADLVSSLAKTYNPTGTITEKDITRAAKVVGQNNSNPKTVAAILKDVESRSADFVNRTYKYSSQATRDAAQPQFETFWEYAAGEEEEEASDDPLTPEERTRYEQLKAKHKK
jgi:hypothetical protein